MEKRNYTFFLSAVKKKVGYQHARDSQGEKRKRRNESPNYNIEDKLQFSSH